MLGRRKLRTVVEKDKLILYFIAKGSRGSNEKKAIKYKQD